jgi:hypothetical protein
VGLCVCLRSDIVSVRVPYSWMFRRMCWAYADWGSFYFIYLTYLNRFFDFIIVFACINFQRSVQNYKIQFSL